MTGKRTPLDLVRAEPGPAHTATFDGARIAVLPGQSVAAALWSAGVTAWRTTRGTGEPRGVFCGIGVCFDCLVTVNGRPNQRACLVRAEAGDDIRTQHGTGQGDASEREER
ncbi:(2Fe-2S)-binding protein [Streptomyces sp. NPDC055144]